MHDLTQPGAGAGATRRAVEIVLIALAVLVPAAPAHADSRQFQEGITHLHAHNGHFTLDVSSSFTVPRGRTMKVGVRISRRGRKLVNGRIAGGSARRTP